MISAEREPVPPPLPDTRSPFARLNELLAGVEPGLPPIALSVGEPQHPVPAFVGPVLAASLDEFDETIAIGREVAAKSFLLVRGIHGDRADCLLRRICARERARLRVERGAAEQRQQSQCPDD